MFLKSGSKQVLRPMALLSLALLCAASAAAQTITAAMQSPLRLLDPIISTAMITRAHAFMIYDTLLATDANFKIRPQMAEKWVVSEDGKTYTFTLRDGLKWHDGVPVKPEVRSNLALAWRAGGPSSPAGRALVGHARAALR